MMVVKRNGEKVPFDKKKIENVLRKAFKSVGVRYSKKVYNNVIDCFEGKETIKVEQIQDAIEKILALYGYNSVLKHFILYREKRAVVRNFVESKEQFINKYKNSGNTADATVDDNSNVSGKNIGILNNEIHKEDNIQISRGMIMRKLKELYPDFDAKQYIRDLDSHIIYKHDESSFAGAIAPYCCSISMYPFLLDGIKGLGGLSAAPKNLDSFCGIYINLIFAVSSQFAGAVATSEFLLYFDYFARKEFGEDYFDRLDEVVRYRYKDGEREAITIGKQIEQHFQQVIYSINQPSAARGMQSAFVNFSYFDKPFFEGMFGNFYFPDGTQPSWTSLSKLQQKFMKWFNAERLKCVLTFPVESFALVYQDGKFVDQESADFVAEQYSEGHSFFTYISDTVDSLSSCCFDGDGVIKVYKDGDEFYISMKDFVNMIDDNIDDYGNKFNTGYQIESYNKQTNSIEKTDIIGTLKKEYTGNIYKIIVDGQEISVTEEHMIFVLDKNDNETKEIPVEFIAKEPGRYLIAVD